MKKKVAIIGAGPAGIISSIILSKEMHVVLFEKMPKIGKKIIASGNGKCNITNMTRPNEYTYNNNFAKEVYEKYDAKAFRQDLFNLGILTKADNENRVYPMSNSSNSVIDNFLYHLENQKVEIHTDTIVIEIKKKGCKYTVVTKDDLFNDFDYVIVSTGGKSNKVLGSNGEGYELLDKLNVKHTNLLPGLVGLKINLNQIRGLDGVRHKVRVKLELDNEIIFEELGEVQFKKDGMSGIVIMNASSVISRLNRTPYLYLDLAPHISKEELFDILVNIKAMNPEMNNLQVLRSLLPKMLAQNLCNKQDNVLISNYVDYIKQMPFIITGTYNFDNSQVTVGGVDLSEINDNFELKKHPNIYVLGELLDIDGICGGYNLHFAFASGKLASESILKKEGFKHE